MVRSDSLWFIVFHGGSMSWFVVVRSGFVVVHSFSWCFNVMVRGGS